MLSGNHDAQHDLIVLGVALCAPKKESA